jgi:carbonic anhydrase/acetyltransferase-like protein (isoleucine patch superfamily)
MKIDHLRIGECVTIGARSTVLHGASVQARSQLGPLTLVMKVESIPGGAMWTGSP